MPLGLTLAVAGHDDSTSALHALHRARKAVRKGIDYEPVPALEREAGGGIIDGIFNSPTKGFTFKLRGGYARRVSDPAAYTREVVAMSETRARYVRIRIRDGQERRDYGRYKHGAVSLVTTLPPWAVRTVARIGPSELEDLMLRLAEAQSREVMKVSGRETYGGGVHLDTAVPHFHSHIPKTSADGKPHPKALFLTAGPWIVGAHRIEAKFPGLLTEKKRDLLNHHLDLKDRAHLIDLRCAEVIDRELEKWVRERGFWADYQADCDDYRRRKIKSQKEEPLRRILQAALGHHARSGVWPLAFGVMNLTAWRLIPRELRSPIMACIRVHQVIRQPSKMLKIGARMLIEADRQPEMKGPRK